MALLNIAPTKSSLLTLRRQLAVAEEGYDLLEQKRQILVFELIKRLQRARDLERQIDQGTAPAFLTLKDTTLDVGSRAIEQAALGTPKDHTVSIRVLHLMGLRLPMATATIVPHGLPFGVSGTSAATDLAMEHFAGLLSSLAELAGLQTTILRLAAELQRTQRRCNALSKIFIPNYRQTITAISATLEEREREAFIMTRLIRDRLAG